MRIKILLAGFLIAVFSLININAYGGVKSKVALAAGGFLVKKAVSSCLSPRHTVCKKIVINGVKKFIKKHPHLKEKLIAIAKDHANKKFAKLLAKSPSARKKYNTLISNLEAIWKYGPESGAKKITNWAGHLTKLRGVKPPGMKRPHAHHIVFKEGSKATRETVTKSKRILEKYNIDWYKGSENLVWAPNKNHSKASAQKVLKALQEADKKFGTRHEVVKALERIGKKFANDTIGKS